MKIFLVMLLSLILAMVSAISVSAAPLLFSLDVLPSGTVNQEGFKNVEDDLEVKIVSGGTMFGKFKVGAEYGVGSIEEDAGANDLTMWAVKAGYRLLDARATKIDAIMAPLVIDTEKNKLEGTLVGLDFTQYFSEKAFLSGSYVIAIDGSHEHDLLGTDDNTSISLLRLKFNYLVAERLGLALGYTDLKYEFEHKTLGSEDVSLGGVSLGVFYLF